MYELVSGVVHRMSPVGGVHGVVVVRLAAALNDWVERQQAGIVITRRASSSPSIRTLFEHPDISFVRRERIAN